MFYTFLISIFSKGLTTWH